MMRNIPAVFLFLLVISGLADTAFEETPKNEDADCPSLFSFCFQPYVEGDATSLPVNMYMDCKNLSWSQCSGYCGNWLGTDYEAVCTTRNNTKCSLYETHGIDIYCPSCSDSLSVNVALTSKCIPYIIDKDCAASVDYFKCLNPKWIACHNGTAVGTCANERKHTSCDVGLQINRKATNATFRVMLSLR